MKKIIVSLLVVVMIITGMSFTPQKVEAKKSWWSGAYQKKNSIQVKWDKYKKATKYEIYRASSKKYDTLLKKSKFKKIKTIRNRNTKKYTDKKIKFNSYYAYYVKVYKGKKVYADSYYKNSQDFVCKGLSAPELSISTNEDHFTNNKYEIHFDIYNTYRGATFSKNFEFYRKQKGDSKFKKISLKKVNSYEYYDENLTKGRNYLYKVRCYTKKKNKKKQYSMFSDVKEVYAGNYYGQYNVKTINPASGEYNTNYLETVIEVNSLSVLNGKTILKGDGGNASYQVNTGENGKNEKWHYYYAKVIGYSYDNNNYQSLPKQGIDLNGKRTYLKISLRTRSDWGKEDDDYMNERIIYGGNNCEYVDSYLDLSNYVTYYGPGEPYSNCSFNLKTGKVMIHS